MVRRRFNGLDRAVMGRIERDERGYRGVLIEDAAL
jgi:hypothetical protein